MYFLVGFPPFLNSKHCSVPGPRFRLFMFMCTLILWMSSASYILLNITHMWRSPIYVTFCDQVLAAYSMSQSRISWAIYIYIYFFLKIYYYYYFTLQYCIGFVGLYLKWMGSNFQHWKTVVTSSWLYGHGWKLYWSWYLSTFSKKSMA